LTPLHISFAVLEAFDVHSSLRALAHGAHEANPLFASLDRWPGAATAVKAGSTLAIVLLTRKVSRYHPKSAVLTMIALDSAYSWIVAHNYRVAH
jgi:hypothetical protein